MNITRKNVDALNAVLSIRVEKNDYESRVNVVLADYRKKARVDGFRPGKIPMGLINKMYRKPVLAEELNKIVSESITKFLMDEKLNVLGEPLPHEGANKPINFDSDSEFEFNFDLGLAPEVDVTITSKDKFPFYTIKVDAEMINKYADSYTQRFGELVSVEAVGEKDLLKAELIQLDANNEPLEGGIHAEEATLSAEVIKDEKIKAEFINLKKDNTLIFNLKKAYPSDVEIASMLHIDKEQASKLESNFKLIVKDISHFKNAEINQELFDKAYGEGTVKSEKEFREKIAADAAENLKQDSDYRFGIDVKEMLIKKTKIDLPKDFLKRWLFTINEGKFTAEQIDQDFDHFAEDLKWQLIKDKISSDNSIEVSDEEIKIAALETARMQFRQYGMANVPDEHLEEFGRRILERAEDKNRLKSKVAEDKLIAFVKNTAKLEEKEISSEKFNKLFEK
jgi:trigger factor